MSFVVVDAFVLLWLITIVWWFAFCRLVNGLCGLLLAGGFVGLVYVNSVVTATITHSLFVRVLNVGFQLF